MKYRDIKKIKLTGYENLVFQLENAITYGNPTNFVNSIILYTQGQIQKWMNY